MDTGIFENSVQIGCCLVSGADHYSFTIRCMMLEGNVGHYLSVFSKGMVLKIGSIVIEHFLVVFE